MKFKYKIQTVVWVIKRREYDVGYDFIGQEIGVCGDHLMA